MSRTREFFHGTGEHFEPGDVLRPGAEVGKQNWPGSNNTVVWLHDNPDAASRYGTNVYAVRPHQWVENFSEDAGHDDLDPAEHEWITPQATVLRRV